VYGLIAQLADLYENFELKEIIDHDRLRTDMNEVGFGGSLQSSDQWLPDLILPVPAVVRPASELRMLGETIELLLPR
jgi:hypothetical protein